jgi:hypothetical protein
MWRGSAILLKWPYEVSSTVDRCLYSSRLRHRAAPAQSCLSWAQPYSWTFISNSALRFCWLVYIYVSACPINVGNYLSTGHFTQMTFDFQNGSCSYGCGEATAVENRHQGSIFTPFFALTSLSGLRHLFTYSDIWINTLQLVYFRLFKHFFIVWEYFFIYAFFLFTPTSFRNTAMAYDRQCCGVVWTIGL